MAAVLAPSSVHSSSHLLVPHRDTFAAFQQHRGSSASHRNPFEAFAPHHHSAANSRSAVASWRQSGPQIVARVPARVDTPSPKFRRSGQSHSRTPPTSSEASSTSWRSHVRSAAVTGVRERGEERNHHLKASSPFVYSVAELLRLSGSPLVGISKESQGVVDELVARYVWRRGVHSGRHRNHRGTSKTRSLHTSTDDSEQSD